MGNKKHVYKQRKETTYERVGKRKTYINNIEEKISTMYVYKWSQDLMYKNNVSKKEKTNSPPKSDYSHIQNYSPFLSQMTKGRMSSRHLISRASISIII